jgi:dihydrofolate reductase
MNQVFERADAFLLGRRTYEIFAGSWGEMAGSGDNPVAVALNTLLDEINLPVFPVVVGDGTRLLPDTRMDTALELVESRATASGVTIQVYRPAGRPQYATATVDVTAGPEVRP